jgi:hypothetical protein
MVAGVLAATIVVTQTTPNTGEIGTYHTNTGTMTVADNGLGVVSTTTAAATTATFPTTGNNNNVNNALTAGNWFDKVTFTDTATDGAAHTATITIRNGPGVSGTLLVSTSFTLTGPGAASTGTITAYVDTGAQSLNSPVTVYVTIT